jgi:hypothetical protein
MLDADEKHHSFAVCCIGGPAMMY